jgi:hypothetical protein
MVQSHPTLSTGVVKFEVKDRVAWGKEVDGVQMGLTTDKHSVRQGETVKFTVNLRNVSKADIKVTYVRLRESSPTVNNAGGGRVKVSMPPSPRYYAASIERVLKPGETIALYDPEVAVQPEDPKIDGEVRGDIPTICVAPGKYKIAYSGMIQSHPKLTTGSVDFEVKDQVAWGKEVDGVQVGILFNEDRVYTVGEIVTLTVRLRNNGKNDVQFRDDAEYFQKNPPLITDADGKAVKIKERNIFGLLRPRSVAPGKEVDLIRLELALRTDREKEAEWTLYGTGNFHIQYKNVPVVGEVQLGAPGITLETGKLDLEVKRPQKVEAQKIKEMQTERLEVLKQRLAIAQKLSESGGANDLTFWLEQVALAEAEIKDGVAAIRAIYERQYADTMVKEKQTEQSYKAGASTLAELLEIRAARIALAIKLAQLPAK